MNTCNYRIIAEKQEDEEIGFSIYLVCYNEDNTPKGYVDVENTSSNTYEGLKSEFGLMQKAFSKPILWGGDKFPDEYKQTN